MRVGYRCTPECTVDAHWMHTENIKQKPRITATAVDSSSVATAAAKVWLLGSSLNDTHVIGHNTVSNKQRNVYGPPW